MPQHDRHWRRWEDVHRASGRFTIGKIGENLTRGVMEFDIKFRDSKDEMGLPDLVIESAKMEELQKRNTIKY